jgi:glycosyltransferase involved in cell wall biosynthesis
MLDNLARGLQCGGHDVLLYSTGDSTCPVPTRWVRDRAAGLDGTCSATELHHVVNAYSTVLEWVPDVIHDHTVLGPLYGGRFESRIVTTNHGPFDGELGDYYRALGSTVPIIAISRHQAAGAVDIPIAAVIHHGVDVEAFPFGAGDGGYVLFLGRMSPDKGVASAIRVARAAGLPLRIAAKMRLAEERAYFDQCIGPMLGPDVEFLGEVGSTDRVDLLARAVCLLNPLVWAEPFGMVMVEALVCGTPVVATPHGSVPEIVTDGVTGFVRSEEPELAAAVRRAGELDRTRCRQEVAERFATGRMVAEHVALYQRVERDGRPRRAA